MTKAEEKALGYLGFAARARRIAAGTALVCECLTRHGGKKSEIPVVLMAADASANTKKRLSDRTAHYGVLLVPLSLSAEALATAVGKKGQSVAAVAVTDAALAKAIAGLYEPDRT